VFGITIVSLFQRATFLMSLPVYQPEEQTLLHSSKFDLKIEKGEVGSITPLLTYE
jgi:hypothetical protein